MNKVLKTTSGVLVILILIAFCLSGISAMVYYVDRLVAGIGAFLLVCIIAAPPLWHLVRKQWEGRVRTE